MIEINCFTNRIIPDLTIVGESPYPMATFRTDPVHVNEQIPGEETLTFDPEVIVESHGYVDLKALISGREDFLREGLFYQKWIDKEGTIRHWHIQMNPCFDPETYRFFTSIAEKLEPKQKTAYIRHVNSRLPAFQLLHGEGMIYDFKDGRKLLGQGDMVLIKHPDGIPQITSDYKGKSIQTILNPDAFVPRGAGVSPEDVEVVAGIRFPQIDLFGIERMIDGKIKSGIFYEDYVREIINPYFSVQR